MPLLSGQVDAQGLPVVCIRLMLLFSWLDFLGQGGLFPLPICVLTGGALTGGELLISSLAAACCTCITCTNCISMLDGPVTSMDSRKADTLPYPRVSPASDAGVWLTAGLSFRV